MPRDEGDDATGKLLLGLHFYLVLLYCSTFEIDRRHGGPPWALGVFGDEHSGHSPI